MQGRNEKAWISSKDMTSESNFKITLDTVSIIVLMTLSFINTPHQEIMSSICLLYFEYIGRFVSLVCSFGWSRTYLQPKMDQICCELALNSL